ncbi:hypothetical protein L2021_09770, partial [Lactobacillus gasseri]|nr:hypothetical protein [Lactobacillus gasseri]
FFLTKRNVFLLMTIFIRQAGMQIIINPNALRGHLRGERGRKSFAISPRLLFKKVKQKFD